MGTYTVHGRTGMQGNLDGVIGTPPESAILDHVTASAFWEHRLDLSLRRPSFFSASFVPQVTSRPTSSLLPTQRELSTFAG